MTDTQFDIKTESRQQIPSSFRFPKLNLETCLAKIKTLYEKNTTNAMSVEAMYADLDYAQRSGSADTVLASLKYYGLLESSSGRYKTAEFIMNYCLGDNLTHAYVKKCLLSVPINKKIFSTYDIDNLPGANEIKSFLIKECKYSLKEATTYIETFQKDIALLSNLTTNGSPSEKSVESTPHTMPPVIVNAGDMLLGNSFPVPSGNMRSYTHPLSNGKYIAIQFPIDINELDSNDLEDARDLLNLVLSKIERCTQNLQASSEI